MAWAAASGFTPRWAEEAQVGVMEQPSLVLCPLRVLSAQEGGVGRTRPCVQRGSCIRHAPAALPSGMCQAPAAINPFNGENSFNECSFTSLQVPLGSLHCLLIPHAALQAKLDLD